MNSSNRQELADLCRHLVYRQAPVALPWLEEIHRRYGTQAAYRATVGFIQTKPYIDSTKELPPLDNYMFFLRDYPEALALLEQMLMTYLGHISPAVEVVN